MKKSTTQKTYSISEANTILEKFIQKSAKRLATNLRTAWKRNAKASQHVRS